MSIEFEVSDVIPATPEAIYKACLDSEEHSRMTGGQAKVSPNVVDTFEAWEQELLSDTSIFLSTECSINMAGLMHISVQ
jgi:hypothetical protein